MGQFSLVQGVWRPGWAVASTPSILHPKHGTSNDSCGFMPSGWPGRVSGTAVVEATPVLTRPGQRHHDRTASGQQAGVVQIALRGGSPDRTWTQMRGAVRVLPIPHPWLVRRLGRFAG